MTRFGAAPFVCLTILASGCKPSTPQHSTSAAAPAPAAASGARLYVSDETGGKVIAIDAANGTVLEAIEVGKRPRGIRVSRDGTQLLVALSGSAIAGPNVDESKL